MLFRNIYESILDSQASGAKIRNLRYEGNLLSLQKKKKKETKPALKYLRKVMGCKITVGNPVYFHQHPKCNYEGSFEI